MNNSYIRIEVPEGKVKEIIDRLNAAQEVIYHCYDELTQLGVLTVKEKTTSCN